MMAQMQRFLGLVLVLAGLAWGGAVAAQDQGQAWVQIEARPSLDQAETRARAYAGVFGNVSGFALRSGWYGIVLGPYSRQDAPNVLAQLRAERMIPRDSFVADGRQFVQQFWPVGANDLSRSLAPSPDVQTSALPPAGDTGTQSGMGTDTGTGMGAETGSDAVQPDATLPQTPAAAPQETPAEARQSEALLSADDRKDLQSALKWFGFYSSGIDGAFGSGTRSAMASWQGAQGYEATGILTTGQRKALLDAWHGALAELGLKQVDDADAGISIDLPMALVAFSHYQPPFAHYDSTGDSGVRVVLISEPGGRTELSALYNSMQSLDIVPMQGPRSLSDRSFEITGQNDRLHSYTWAEVTGGNVKGYTLAWPPADDAKMQKVLAAMKESFRSTGDASLDATAVPVTEAQRRGLLAGLALRKPVIARSGFYVDGAGDVLTTAEAVQNCGRITFGADHAARVVARDEAAGLALLRPEEALTPIAYARFADAAPRIGSKVTVAGFSYAGVLPTAAMSFGKIEDLRGLNGEAGLRRLSVPAMSGDAGGPVLDAEGAVIGMLLPHESPAGKQLPASVNFAAGPGPIGTLLQRAGGSVTTRQAPLGGDAGPMAPEDLTRLGRDMTVLVSCWK